MPTCNDTSNFDGRRWTENEVSLPKLTLKPGYIESYRGSTHGGYDDLLTMFKDLHEGVLEVGPGAEVLVHDAMSLSPPRVGFTLCKQGDESFHWWDFLIEVPKLKVAREKLPPKLNEAFGSVTGRLALAKLFQAGVSPDRFDLALNSS